MFFACIDLGINDIALSYLRQIKEQFPESKRVYRLIGILHEADGELAEAEELYKLVTVVVNDFFITIFIGKCFKRILAMLQ